MIHKPEIIERTDGGPGGSRVMGIFVECDDDLDLEAVAWTLAQAFEERERIVNAMRAKPASDEILPAPVLAEPQGVNRGNRSETATSPVT